MNAALLVFLLLVTQNFAYSSDYTDRVFLKIEFNAVFRKMYDNFCKLYGQANVNKRLGRLIKTENGFQNTGRKKAKSSLIRTYTLH